MPLTYMSGDEIRSGDRVLFHGNSGEIEFVADPLVFDPATQWYVQEYGGGVMVLEPDTFGRTFLSEPETDDDLELVRRAGASQQA